MAGETIISGVFILILVIEIVILVLVVIKRLSGGSDLDKIIIAVAVVIVATVILNIAMPSIFGSLTVSLISMIGGGNGSVESSPTPYPDPGSHVGTITPKPNISPTPPSTPVLAWNQNFGGPEEEHGYAVVEATDGGYAVAGEATSWGNGNEMYLVKADENGAYKWSKTFGGPGEDTAYSICKTPEDGYMIVGDTTTWGEKGEIYPVMADSNGNYKWSGSYGGSGVDRGRSVTPTKDGGYVLAGDTTSSGNGGSDVYIVKVDSDGKLKGSSAIGGTGNEHGYSATQTSDSGYIVVGDTTTYGNGSTDIYLVKTDKDCNPQWKKTFGGPESEHGYSVAQTTDGGYIIAGDTSSYGNGSYDVYLVKTGSDGSPQWAKTFGGEGNDHGKSVLQTSDGNFLVVGDTASYTNGGSDVYVLKVDQKGNLLWSVNYGGSGDEHGNAVIKSSDGSYVIAGDTTTFTNGGSDYYLLKVKEAKK